MLTFQSDPFSFLLDGGFRSAFHAKQNERLRYPFAVSGKTEQKRHLNAFVKRKRRYCDAKA